MKVVYVVAVAALVLSGCAIMQPKVVTHNIAGKFDAAYAKEQISPGAGLIEGTAFLRQQGGGVVTCAGQDTYLMPVTDYAADRLWNLYGSVPSSSTVVSRSAYEITSTKILFSPEIPEYLTHSRATKCDAQGEFAFRDVKDGNYYVVASVIWQVRGFEGGQMATRVKVENGKAPRLIMTR